MGKTNHQESALSIAKSSGIKYFDCIETNTQLFSMSKSDSPAIKLTGIKEPNPHDVLCGRGAKVANFP